MPFVKPLSAALSTAIFLAMTPAAFAETAEAQVLDAKVIEEVGGAERINLAGKLRMLSQRLPAAACYLHAGVAPDLAKKVLAGTTAEFEQIVYALEHGDPSLGIFGPEKRRKTLAALAALHEKWDPLDAAAHLILDEGPSTSLIQQLADENNPLLESAKLLVSEISGQYSDPASLLQADALRIDIAGRQRMLSQRMSKDACLMMSDINKEAAAKELATTAQVFDVSLTALIDGMPAAGIKASDDPAIIAGLEVVKKDWMVLQDKLTVLKSGGTLDAEKRAALFEGLNVLLVDMNKVVMMYSNTSKQDT